MDQLMIDHSQEKFFLKIKFHGSSETMKSIYMINKFTLL